MPFNKLLAMLSFLPILSRLFTFDCRRFFGLFACAVLKEEIGNVIECTGSVPLHQRV